MWRPQEQFDPQVALEVINSRNALSGSGSDGLPFSHLQSNIRTGVGRETFDAGTEAFWRRIIDSPSAFPTEVWQLFLQSNLTFLERKTPPSLHRLYVKMPPCARDHVAVAAAAKGDQP